MEQQLISIEQQLISIEQRLNELRAVDNYRSLPQIDHHGKQIQVGEQSMLNLSSNDYLGLAEDLDLRRAFLDRLTPERFIPTSSSSRLLTGNFSIYRTLEEQLAHLFGTEAALVFNSGYHANMGILPAISDSNTLILADKLVHASLVDGIRLSTAKSIRFRHNDLEQVARLLDTHHAQFERIILVSESIFSMDGDEADLPRLVELKQRYPNVWLYIDEAHAVGVRGKRGLGCAEEHGCIQEIDFLVGTFGKALASVGAYLVCRQPIRDYLINKMRTLIFTTALPPINIEWTSFVLSQLEQFSDRREHLQRISRLLHDALARLGGPIVSSSHILPLLAGESREAVRLAGTLQDHGFYVLPVRPPTVPEGTSRLRFSLNANLTEEEIGQLITVIQGLT